MTVAAWRIFKPRHASTAFTGEGARLFGGRWNNTGTALVYTAGSAALAALEMLVHLDAHELLQKYHLVQVTFDASVVEEIDPHALPSNWHDSPAPPAMKRLGDDWASSGRSAVLRVPSVLVEEESNYLLNPAHADFAKISIGPPRPFAFDPRLAKSSGA